jgi:flagellar biosynthesis GTPase FlhF
MNDAILAAGPIAAKVELPSGSEMTAQKVLTRASGIKIDTDADYIAAADFANECKGMLEKEDADRVELKKDFLAGCRRIDAYFRNPINLYDQAFKTVKSAMLAYDERKRKAAEAEQRRLAEVRRQEELEQQRREAEAQRRIRAEEQARREAQERADAEQRARTEAAEAEARKEREARLAAEAKARGDQEAAEAANRRAAAAEAEAKKANEQARLDREAAIEARRKQLRAERESQTAIATADAGADAVTAATTAALNVDMAATKVSGVARRMSWRWKLREGKQLADVPRKFLILDTDYIQSVCDKVKNKEDAEKLLDGFFEVWSEAELAVGKKRGA